MHAYLKVQAFFVVIVKVGLSDLMQNCIATHFLAVRDVDDFHLDRLPVQHQLLPVAQVCKSEKGREILL